MLCPETNIIPFQFKRSQNVSCKLLELLELNGNSMYHKSYYKSLICAGEY